MVLIAAKVQYFIGNIITHNNSAGNWMYLVYGRHILARLKCFLDLL